MQQILAKLTSYETNIRPSHLGESLGAAGLSFGGDNRVLSLKPTLMRGIVWGLKASKIFPSVFKVFFLLRLIVLSISLSACAKKEIEPETYLIPAGFVGDFYVIYNVESGLAPEYESGVRLFRVPATGMIHTQLQNNVGIGYPGMIRFFYVSEDGARVEITDNYGSGVEDTAENRNDKRLYVMGGGFGEFGFTEETTSHGCKYNHQHFYVGTLADALEGAGYFRMQDFYLEYGYPCP